MRVSLPGEPGGASPDTLGPMRTRSGGAVRAGTALVVAVTLAAGLTMALAAPAAANRPARGWGEGSDMSLGFALLLFVGGPLAICVLISLLVVAPSVARGSRGQQQQSWWGEAQWFGGELGAGSAERPQLEAAAGATSIENLDQAATGGGASARW
jgi:hypothetical protein